MGLFSAISDAVNSVVDAVQDVVQGTVDLVQDGANAVIDGVQGAIEGVIGDTFLSDILDGVQGGLNGVVDFVQDGADSVVDLGQTFYGLSGDLLDFVADPLIPDVVEDPLAAVIAKGGELAGEGIRLIDIDLS